jgi:circadian clock protein KaiB
MTTKRKAARAPAKTAAASKAQKGRHTAAEFEALIRKTRAGKRYVLKLYVTGTSPRSAQAVSSIRSLCDEHLAGRYDLVVIDIYQQPAQASSAQIIAAPTLVKEYPKPARRMVGDLGNRARVLIGLDLQMAASDVKTTEVRWVAL